MWLGEIEAVREKAGECHNFTFLVWGSEGRAVCHRAQDNSEECLAFVDICRNGMYSSFCITYLSKSFTVLEVALENLLIGPLVQKVLTFYVIQQIASQ